MAESTHRVEVVRLESVTPHPNADALDLVTVWGYPACVRRGDFKPGDLIAYVPPDSVVDTTRPEFSFLGTHTRIKAKRLRGWLSMGLVIPAPPGAVEGDDVAGQLGITHYEPPAPDEAGAEAGPPPLSGYVAKFDVEAMRRYTDLFTPGEPVQITEKLHGGSARFVWANGRMHCGSRTEWKAEGAGQPWRALAATPGLRPFCEAHPEFVVYGEIIGSQSLKYGIKPGEVRFAAFDLLNHATGLWVDGAAARELASDIPWAPVVEHEMPFGFERVCELAEGRTLIAGANHVREGIVARPVKERTDPRLGRVILKVVGVGYYEKS